MYETNKRDYTLGEWLDTWLEEIAPTKRKPNTISIYRDARRRLLTLNRPLSSRQVKKEKLRHEGLVPVSKGSQTL